MNINILTREDVEDFLQKLENLIIRFEDQESKVKSPQLYTNEQLANKLRVCKKTLANWRNQGIIDFSQLGRKIYYSEYDVKTFLNKYNKKTF